MRTYAKEKEEWHREKIAEVVVVVVAVDGRRASLDI